MLQSLVNVFCLFLDQLALILTGLLLGVLQSFGLPFGSLALDSQLFVSLLAGGRRPALVLGLPDDFVAQHEDSSILVLGTQGLEFHQDNLGSDHGLDDLHFGELRVAVRLSNTKAECLLLCWLDLCLLPSLEGLQVLAVPPPLLFPFCA